jgi:hypothetical protein
MKKFLATSLLALAAFAAATLSGCASTSPTPPSAETQQSLNQVEGSALQVAILVQSNATAATEAGVISAEKDAQIQGYIDAALTALEAARAAAGKDPKAALIAALSVEAQVKAILAAGAPAVGAPLTSDQKRWLLTNLAFSVIALKPAGYAWSEEELQVLRASYAAGKKRDAQVRAAL